jgi:hypothetical protein
MQLRSPVSIVLTVGTSAHETLACLESLKPTLGIRDQVILVEPTGISASRWGESSWLEKVTVPAGTALDTARTLAASSARHDVVVFLDDDTLPTAHWLDPLVAPLADETVAAVGPRTTRALGSQCVDVPAEHNRGPAGLRRFAREWRQAHRHKVSGVAFLTGVCLAVRRDDVIAAGSVSSALDTGRLVVAHEVFLPHFASESCTVHEFDTLRRPLLSANLIVKDEEDVLADCLASLAGLVDEIVVYDTGSSDATVAIAEQAGATVVQGYWDDHFGDARNRSLDRCTGHWALWIDADETATGDFAHVRSRLASANTEGFLIQIENLSGGGIGASSVFSAVRLFRPDVARYAGRLHEQVLHREAGRGVQADHLPTLKLIHSGYLSERISERDKNNRNLRLAELAVDSFEVDGAVDEAMALCNLARSQCSMGEYDKARETCERAATFTNNSRNLRTVLHTGAHVEIAAERPKDAWPWVERLREISATPHMANSIAAKIWVMEGEPAKALELIKALPEHFTDEDGKAVRRDNLLKVEVVALHRIGRSDEAVQRLLDAITHGVSDLHLVDVLQLLRSADVPVVKLVEALPEPLWKPFLAQVLQAPPSLGDEMLEAMWQHRPADPGVLAAAVRLGPTLSVLRALEWSSRLRAAGLVGACPLVALASDASRTSRDRVLAAAVALELYADERAMGLLSEALPEVPDEETTAVLDDVHLLAPSIAGMLELTPSA